MNNTPGAFQSSWANSDFRFSKPRKTISRLTCIYANKHMCLTSFPVCLFIASLEAEARQPQPLSFQNSPKNLIQDTWSAISFTFNIEVRYCPSSITAHPLQVYSSKTQHTLGKSVHAAPTQLILKQMFHSNCKTAHLPIGHHPITHLSHWSTHDCSVTCMSALTLYK